MAAVLDDLLEEGALERLQPASPEGSDHEASATGTHELAIHAGSQLIDGFVQGHTFGSLQQRRRIRPWLIAASGFGTLLVLVCTFVGHFHCTHASLDLAAASQNLNTVGSVKTILSSMSDGIHSVADVTDRVRWSYHNITQMYRNILKTEKELGKVGSELESEITRPAMMREHLREEFWSLNQTQKEKIKKRLMKKFNITDWKQLRPPSNLHDNNTCADDEELLSGLCYKKCSLLTHGSHPVRLSAWSCCFHEPPCAVAIETHGGPCSGYGVSGDSSGNGCPHPPGTCLRNEEMWDNLCYNKCSFLTFGVLPYRAGAGTCCKVKSRFAFWEGVCDTVPMYSGGLGDHDELTPEFPHWPMTQLTEA